MKNHWLKVREQKNSRFWTAEFSDKGMYVLRPRRIDLINGHPRLGFMGMGQGSVSLNFQGALTGINDKEFSDFLSEFRNGHPDWLSCLRHYQGISNELEFFELTGLTYTSIGMGKAPEDMKVVFAYSHLKHFHCA